MISVNGQSVEACGCDAVKAALSSAARPLSLTV
eukprot:COSAG03_NODE_27446_length_253_cov_0.668831_1_plen_32_part_10